MVRQEWDRYRDPVRLLRAFIVASMLLAIPAGMVRAEDLKRWRFVLPSGEYLTENGTIQVIEGLPSVYTNRVIYYDPYGRTPNRCALGCTFTLDSYQNEEGTTTTSTTSTTVAASSTTSSTTTTTTTTTIASSSIRWSGMTLRLAQVSTTQMQVNGCLNLRSSAVSISPVQAVTATWRVTRDGVEVASGSDATAATSSLGASDNVACVFLANVTGLSPSTEYTISFTAGISGDTVTGSRTVTTSNAPTTTTSTTTTTTTTTTTVPDTTTTTAEVATTGTVTGSRTTRSATTRRSTTTTSPDAVEDDGEVDEDYAELAVRKAGTRYEVRIYSTYAETEMVVRARSVGKRSITWRFTTGDTGQRRFVTSQNLAGYTLTLWVDDERADSIRVG